MRSKDTNALRPQNGRWWDRSRWACFRRQTWPKSPSLSGWMQDREKICKVVCAGRGDGWASDSGCQIDSTTAGFLRHAHDPRKHEHDQYPMASAGPRCAWCARGAKQKTSTSSNHTRCCEGVNVRCCGQRLYSSEMDFRRPSVARPIDCHSPTSCRRDQLGRTRMQCSHHVSRVKLGRKY
jgi:hypothetical protein